MILFNLYSCDEATYPSINAVESNELLPFLGKKVYINGDSSKVYTVGRMVSAVMPDIPFSSEPFNNVFTVTSVKVNGVQYLNTPASTTIAKNADPSTYINYMPSNTNDQNIGTYLGQNTMVTDGQPTTYVVGNSGLYLFLKTLIENILSLPIDVAKQNVDYFTTVYPSNLKGEQTYDLLDYGNLIFQKRDADSFEIEFYFVDASGTDPSHTAYNNVRFKLVFDENQVATIYEDNIVSTTFNPTFTFDQVAVYPHDEFNLPGDVLNPVETDSCPVTTAYYQTNVDFVNCGVDDCCDSISFEDTSTLSNTFAGHSTFGYRLIRVVRPDGTVYEYSSATSDEPDQVINVLGSGINMFNYQFLPTDTDGIWEVQLYNFPEWNSGVMYNVATGVIVHQNDVLYICKESNQNVSPEDDTDNIYWEPYTLDDSTLDTRYGESIKKVVLCISLIGCYRKMVEDGLCSAESNPCAPICDNKKLMQASKVRVIWDAIIKAECNNDFNRVKDLVDMWKSSCSCVNC